MKIIARVLIFLLLVTCHFLNTEFSVWSSAVFYLVVTLLSVLSVIQFCRSNKQIKINIPEILLLAFVAYLFMNNSIRGTFWDNTGLYNFLLLLLLYFALVMLYNSDKEIFKFITFGLFVGQAIELIVGFGQLFGLIPNSDLKFTLGGLFGNPGAFAGYLAILLPFLLITAYFYKQLLFKSENLLYAIVFCLFCGASIIIWCDSRGAWVAGFLSIIYVLNHKYKINKLSFIKTNAAKTGTIVVLLLSIVLISIALFRYKQESANGRLFVWKVSKPMVLENPLFGNGFGSFEADYGKVQAAYFLSNKSLASEVEIADYVTCAYNEFLEMQIESGIIGLSLFIVILYFALAKRRKINCSEYLIAAKASLLALLFLSMVSYPFSLVPNLLFFVICLFICFRCEQYKTITFSKYSKPLVFVWLLAMLGISYVSCRQVYGLYYFKEGYAKVINNDLENGIDEYKKTDLFFTNNKEFQFYYGAALYLKHDYLGSIAFLQKAVTLGSEPNAFITLGKALQQLKRYSQAEDAYRMATGITPAKLYPQYLLAKLYIKMHQSEKAIKIAKTIIAKKEKVPTTAGSEIKTEMRVLINQYTQPDVKPFKTTTMSQ